MMNKVSIKTLIALTIFVFLGSCGKFGAGTPCDVDVGDITIYNFHSDPYNLYIDDLFKTQMEAWDTLFLELHWGTHIFTLKQAGGYDSVPVVYENKIAIDACTSTAWGPHSISANLSW